MSELTEAANQQDEAQANLAAADSGQPEAITALDTPAGASEAKPVDPMEEVRAELEKTKKALKDTQAWGTKNSQRLAEIERERQQQLREASKPAILDQNPELADAIRYVAGDPAPQRQAESKQQEWQHIVQSAIPGIFDADIDPELETALLAKRDALGDAWYDPITAIREITAEKLAYTERMIGKKFMAEAAKSAQKSAMTVPGAGASGARAAPVDPQQEMVKRFKSMSPIEFEKERRRVLGY